MKAHIWITSSVKLAAVVLLGAASLSFTSCFYVPGVSGGNAWAGLVLPRSLVANPISLALIVGGPGMESIYASYTTIPPSISIEVPSGLARTFTVLLNSPSATLQGVATVDLQPGETKDINLILTAAGTQIVVPDNYTSRLVQIADMSGTGWYDPPPTIDSPYDVDFDDQGRIYVAYANYLGGPGILRMNDITDTSPTTLTGVSGSSMRSIAMDRLRGLLYYTDGGILWRIDPTVGTEEIVQLNTIPVPPEGSVYMSYVTGIAVDSDGFVYVANSSSSYPAATILKINPNPASSPTLVASSSHTFSNPWDVLVNGDYIYVSDPAASTPQIVRLDKDLKFVDSITGHGADSFLGPERFVAILNKPITVIDEPSSGGVNRLISFNDMTGAGWATYGTGSGSGTGQFMFFNC